MVFFHKLKKSWEILARDQKKVLTYILLTALLGIFLVVWSNTNLTTTQRSVEMPIKEREEEISIWSLEERLASNLSQMAGVGEVRVQIYYSSSSRYVFGKDERVQEKMTLEEDSQGGNKQSREEGRDYSVVVMRDGSGGEVALIKEEFKPMITGVLIVAQGAGEVQIKNQIIRSVSTLLDLPLHRIEVVSGKGG